MLTGNGGGLLGGSVGKGGATSSSLSPAGISLAAAWGQPLNNVLLADSVGSNGSTGQTGAIQPVPAPMLAAAARSAGSQDGNLLGFVSRHALPGLLIAIATAIVGFVAAGNIKALAPKVAGLYARLQELDAHAKTVLTTSSARLSHRISAQAKSG